MGIWAAIWIIGTLLLWISWIAISIYDLITGRGNFLPSRGWFESWGFSRGEPGVVGAVCCGFFIMLFWPFAAGLWLLEWLTKRFLN